MIKTKQWSVGSGSATIQYDGQGDGNIIIISDANSLYEARSMQITVDTINGSPKQTKTITINQAAKQRIDLSDAEVTAATQTYNGSAKTPTPTVTLNGSTVPSTGYDVSYSNNTNAGTATITITGKGEYTGTAYGTFTINKATPSYTAPTRNTGLTYNGSSQYLTTSGSTSHGTIYYSTNGSNWYTSRRTGTNAGTYYCYWKLVGDSNHTDINSTYLGTTSIAKASRTITGNYQPINIEIGESKTPTFNISAGSGDGTIVLSASNSRISVSGGTITGVSTGSCTITAEITEGANYLSASTSWSMTCTEAKRHNQTISVPYTSNAFVGTNGSVTSATMYRLTDFIAVVPGERVKFTASGSASVLCFSAYFDNSQTSIVLRACQSGYNTSGDNPVIDFDVTIPSDVHYIRICKDNRVLSGTTVDIYFV